MSPATGNDKQSGRTRDKPLATFAKAMLLIDGAKVTGVATIVILDGDHDLHDTDTNWQTTSNTSIRRVVVTTDWHLNTAETFTVKTVKAVRNLPHGFPTITTDEQHSGDSLRGYFVRYHESGDSAWCANNTIDTIELVQDIGNVKVGQKFSFFKPAVTITWSGKLLLDGRTTNVPLTITGGIHLMPGITSKMNCDNAILCETYLTSNVMNPFDTSSEMNWGTEELAGICIDATLSTEQILAGGNALGTQMIWNSMFTAPRSQAATLTCYSYLFTIMLCYFEAVNFSEGGMEGSLCMLNRCFFTKCVNAMVTLNANCVLQLCSFIDNTRGILARGRSSVSLLGVLFDNHEVCVEAQGGSSYFIRNAPKLIEPPASNVLGAHLTTGSSMYQASLVLQPPAGLVLGWGAETAVYLGAEKLLTYADVANGKLNDYGTPGTQNVQICLSVG
jgi:hypothetical protein